MDISEGSQEASHAAEMCLLSAYIDSAGNPDTSGILYGGLGLDVRKWQATLLLRAVLLPAWLGQL